PFPFCVYLAQVNYSFDNRYFLSGSVSMDGSSRFGTETVGGINFLGESWGLFPSLNAGWLISSEEFMSGVDNSINLLKLRGGVSITGNDELPPLAAYSYFLSKHYSDRANGLVLGNIGSKEIQWETTTKLNAGLDASFFNERLSVSADVYENRTTDLLVMRDLPEHIGSGSYWKNEGELKNRGYEISGNIRVLNLKDVSWEISNSTGYYDNEIVSLPNGSFTTDIYGGGEVLTAEGLPAGVFYGYKTKGIFNTSAEAEQADLRIVDEKGGSSYFRAGDVYFDDKDNNGIINEKDKQVIGDPNPLFYGNFSTSIGVKDFTLDAYFSYSYGNDVYNYLRSELESGSAFENQTKAMLNRWRGGGQETEIPIAVYGDPMENSRFSDKWIEDGSYVKLKTLKLSYDLSVNTKFLESVKIWASANNLWTLTDYLGRDPEVSSGSSVLYQGIDYGLTPATRSVFLGVKMNL
ncbi:MAG: SusC/RagA family TonB-linked outer membrane protein, partial [bacterium]